MTTTADAVTIMHLRADRARLVEALKVARDELRDPNRGPSGSQGTISAIGMILRSLGEE